MYDYFSNISQDIRDYIAENITLSDFSDREELEETLNDDLWVEDSVTGNASGSYYCNAYKAEEALSHNWDLLAEALAEFGENMDVLEKGAEWCDVSIRCYLLSGCISSVLDEMEEAGKLQF